MSMPTITTVITDLDNTLWDWVEIWHRPFTAMLGRLVEKSGIPQGDLEREIRTVHQQHGTSEYAFLIEKLPSLREMHPGADLTNVYADAIDAYRKERNQALRLYDGVERTLQALRARGCLLVGYTESMAFYTNYRLRKTGVDDLLDYLYSPEDHGIPHHRNDLRKYPNEHYRLRRTEHRHTPPGEAKPNPHILHTILEEVGATPAEAVYVGDSKTKDIAMAQEVGVLDAWARYGGTQHTEAYELLRRVSHWPDSAVENEKHELVSNDIEPTATLTAFADLLTLADYQGKGET